MFLLIDVGVAELSVADPPEIERAKSATSKSPEPPVVSYTFSLKVTSQSIVIRIKADTANCGRRDVKEAGCRCELEQNKQ